MHSKFSNLKYVVIGATIGSVINALVYGDPIPVIVGFIVSLVLGAIVVYAS